MNLCFVVGARPNFIKLAPIVQTLKNYPKVEYKIIHTGQHYDYNMSGSFFDNLNIPNPNIHLEIGSGSQSWQTAEIMKGLDLVDLDGILILFGDVNSTLAAALVAAKKGIPTAHIESGFRSFDRTMPEEINRIVADSLSNILLTSAEECDKNLLGEGHRKESIIRVGGAMANAVFYYKDTAKKLKLDSSIKDKKYILVTLHRPSNVDLHEKLGKIINVLDDLSKEFTIVFPMHPRTRKVLNNLNFVPSSPGNFFITEPESYLKFINLEMNATIVLTDSGGIQEETTCLGVPCLTLRNSTEHLSTIKYGTNKLFDGNFNDIKDEVKLAFDGKWRRGGIPELWDNNISHRMINSILEFS